jgi:hypothetical protein
MILLGHTAHTEKKRSMQAGTWCAKLKERDHLEKLHVYGGNPLTEHIKLSIIIQLGSFNIILFQNLIE